MPKKTFTLTMNEHQAQTVVRALDLFSRIGIGQFEEMVRVYESTTGFKSPVEKVHAAQRMVEEAKRELTGYAPSASFGINNPAVDDVFRVAYDLQQVLRHRIAWDQNPKGGSGVSFQDPMQTGQEPLAKVTG